MEGCVLPELKKSRGRPKKPNNGDFVRDLIVIEAHERFRLSKMGRLKAIQATLNEVKSKYPNLKLCSTTVKKILAKLQPEIGLLFEHATSDNWQAGVFRVTKIQENPTNPTPEMLLMMPDLEGKTLTRYTLSHAARPEFQKRGRQTVRNNLTFGKKST